MIQVTVSEKLFKKNPLIIQNVAEFFEHMGRDAHTIVTPAGIEIKEVIAMRAKTCLWCKWPIPMNQLQCGNCGGHA